MSRCVGASNRLFKNKILAVEPVGEAAAPPEIQTNTLIQTGRDAGLGVRRFFNRLLMDTFMHL